MSEPHSTERIAAEVYSAIFDSHAIGVALWDDQRRLLEGNAALGAIFGLAGTDDLRSRRALAQLASVEQRSSFDALLVEVTGTQAGRIFELAIGREGRTSRVVGAAMGTRGLGGGICIFIDTGHRAGGHARGYDIASRMAAIGILAAGVAHEINNPLAYAMGNLSFAIEHIEGYDPSTPELAIVLLALRDALEGTERVRRTVSDLKTFSRPSSGSMGPVDVEKVLVAAISMARVDVQYRARLTTDFDLLPLVTGSEAHLAQVFLTLLLYAAQGLDGKEVENNEIRVTSRHGPSTAVTVEIASTCSGDFGVIDISPEAQLSGEPAGFGLAFCRRTVEEYGGKMAVEHTPGKVRIFRVALVVSPDARPKVRTELHAKTFGQRAKVLVVDDEPRIGSAISRILGPMHDVTAVHSAADALARLEKGEEYDVILCDLLMPQMTGTDLYRSLETKAPRFTKRIVFMTGGPFSMRGADLLEAVTNRRLEKPFSPAALRDVVRDLVAEPSS